MLDSELRRCALYSSGDGTTARDATSLPFPHRDELAAVTVFGVNRVDYHGDATRCCVSVAFSEVERALNDSVLTRIRELLLRQGVGFTEKEHPPTYTSEESAAARGEALGVGAKALLLKTDEMFRLFVLPADSKLDSAAIKRELRVKKVRFASADELHELTGLAPGSVPPFGQPVLPFELYADESLGATHGRIAFNAGSLTHSIILSAADWEAAARPKRFSFAKG